VSLFVVEGVKKTKRGCANRIELSSGKKNRAEKEDLKDWRERQQVRRSSEKGS